MSNRVAIIAFDAADVPLLRRLLEAGRLPHLAGFLEQGRAAMIDDLQSVLTAPSWTTLSSGTSPADLGVLSSHQLLSGSYRVVPTELAAAARRPPLWGPVSDAGLSSTIVSLYGVRPLPGFNGVQVVGWGSHDSYARDRWISDPPGLVEELERRFGPRELRYHSLRPRSPAEVRRYVARALRGIEQQAEALGYLAETTDWSLLAGSFADCHQAGHYLWHLDDPAHPAHDPAFDPELRDSLARIYTHVDAGIAAVVARLPADTTVLLISPYSMCINHNVGGALDDVLVRCAFTRRAEARRDGIRTRAIAAGRRAARTLLPARARFALGPRLRRDHLVAELNAARVDWARSGAFALPGDTSSGIRVNLTGRDPQGTVQPGAAYDRLCDELIDCVGRLRDADSGVPLAERVLRFDELTGHEASGPMPDICIQWRRPSFVRALAVDGAEVPVPPDDTRMSGHVTPGFVAGSGPGIAGSGSARLEGPAARLADLAPTVLDLLEVDAPSYFDGERIGVLSGAQARSPRL
jgi:predicted AlkP superfamily phosphohydrolase/phosphomutase